VDHPIVDVFAFQEALLVEAVLAIALLAMIWAGFRRWLQYKEKMGRLIAEQTAEGDTRMERVEARLKAIEQIVSNGDVQTQIGVTATNASSDPVAKRDEV
jgi:predicted phage tail protein